MNNEQQSPLIGHFYRVQQSVYDHIETEAEIPSVKATASTSSSSRSLRRKTRPCLLLGHNENVFVILLVSTFGGRNPEREDLLLPIHPTEALGSQRPIVLQTTRSSAHSVLDTPHKFNQYLILRRVHIERTVPMEGPMAETVTNEDLMYVKSSLLDREMGWHRSADAQGISNDSSSSANAALLTETGNVVSENQEDDDLTDDDDSSVGDSYGSSASLIEHFRRMANAAEISPGFKQQRVKEWLETIDEAQ